MAREIVLPMPHAGLQRVLGGVRRFNWLAAGRRWRKTTGFGVCPAVEAAVTGRTVFWGAPTYDQVRIGWEEMHRAVVDVATFNQGRMSVDFPGGGRVLFRSLDNPDNARGHTADRVILDEAAFIKARAWFEVVRPMLIDTGGDLYAMTSPNGLNWFFEEHAKAEDMQDSASWRAPTLGARVDDATGLLVREPHLLENPEISFEELESLFATMSTQKFRQEILAEFVDAGDAVFRSGDVDRMTVGWHGLRAPESGRRYVTAWDIGRRRDPTWGLTIDWTTEPYQVVASGRVLGLPYPGIQDLINKRALDYGGRTIVETNGPGDPVLENLDVQAEGFQTTARNKVDAITTLQMLLERGMLKADIPQLEREIRAYRWDDKDLVQDGVMALAIAAAHLPVPGRASLPMADEPEVSIVYRPATAGVRSEAW